MTNSPPIASATEPHRFAYLPKAALSVSRAEFYGQDAEHHPLELKVKVGMTEQECELPDNLQGHVFIVGPVGSVASFPCPGSEQVVLPAQDGWTHLFNGDGMVYRLDFHKTCSAAAQVEKRGKAWLASRIVKSPDYYADEALHTNPKYRQQWPEEYPRLAFFNAGISRLSLALGARNSLNTAFLPMKFSDQEERLLVTWDAGRPYEIDPCTLDLIGPIGWREQWVPMVAAIAGLPFFLALSTAHPQFDSQTQEMFTVNASKSLRTILWVTRLFKFDAKRVSDHYLKQTWLKGLFKRFIWLPIQVLRRLEKRLNVWRLNGRDAVYLNRWTGSGTAMEQWQILQSNGRPIRIRQSMHQMGLTKDYVILSDSAFKVVIEDELPNADPDHPLIGDFEAFERFAREYLSYPQLPYTDLYFIRRDQLRSEVKAVRAQRVRISPETAHFAVDYQNLEGKVTLHIAHTAATDPAEFIHGTDEALEPMPESAQILRERAGMGLNGMDLSRLGCWVIDPATGTVEQTAWVDSTAAYDYLWALSLSTEHPAQKNNQLTDIYWNCWGAWPAQMSQFFFEMYKDYKNRVVPLSTLVDEVIKQGKPANLLRTHVERSSGSLQIAIADAYTFPPGYLGNSPQFVPRPGSQEPTDGYVVCVVLFSDNLLQDNTELWIFDAQDLSSGPRYRLSHPELNLGFTVHTAWLSQLTPSPVRTDYSVRKDYEAAVQQTGSAAIATLFEEDVYPHFECAESSVNP